ncbi:hypothetical protein KIF59_16945 [Enterobacter cloacae subsp. cloacae]|nr:hypothetical protein [Enterobacter cloacae subsp. cloacae]
MTSTHRHYHELWFLRDIYRMPELPENGRLIYSVPTISAAKTINLMGIIPSWQI